MILLEGAAEVVPAALFDQLKNGGRLVCVLGRGPAGKAMIYRRTDGDLSGRAVFDAAAALAAGLRQAAGVRVLEPGFVNQRRGPAACLRGSDATARRDAMAVILTVHDLSPGDVSVHDGAPGFPSRRLRP